MTSAVAAFLHMQARKSADAAEKSPFASRAARVLQEAAGAAAVSAVSVRGVDRLASRVDALTKAVESAVGRLEKLDSSAAKAQQQQTSQRSGHGGGSGGGGIGLAEIAEGYLGISAAKKFLPRLARQVAPWILRYSPQLAVGGLAAYVGGQVYDRATESKEDRAKREAQNGGEEDDLSWIDNIKDFRDGKRGFIHPKNLESMRVMAKKAEDAWVSTKKSASDTYSSVTSSVAKSYAELHDTFDKNRAALEDWSKRNGRNLEEWFNDVYSALRDSSLLNAIRGMAVDWLTSLRQFLSKFLPSSMGLGQNAANQAALGGEAGKAVADAFHAGMAPTKTYSFDRPTPTGSAGFAAAGVASGAQFFKPSMGSSTEAAADGQRDAFAPGAPGIGPAPTPGVTTAPLPSILQRGGAWQAPSTSGASVDAPNVMEQQSKLAATRRGALDPELRSQLQFAAEKTGLHVGVFSGGQRMPGAPDAVGTHRHDGGKAADLNLYEVMPDGKKRMLDWNNPNDAVRMSEFTKHAVRAGATGVGAGPNYMGTRAIHVGGSGNAANERPGTWGPGGKAPWLDDAFRAGRADAQGGKQEFEEWKAARAAAAKAAKEPTADKPPVGDRVVEDPSQAYRQQRSPFGGKTGGEAADEAKAKSAEERKAAEMYASDYQGFTGANAYRYRTERENELRKYTGADPVGRAEGQSQDDVLDKGESPVTWRGDMLRDPDALRRGLAANPNIDDRADTISGWQDGVSARRAGSRELDELGLDPGGDPVSFRPAEDSAPEPAVPSSVKPKSQGAQDDGDDESGGSAPSGTNTPVSAGRQSLSRIPTLPKDVNLSYMAMGDDV